MNAPQRLDPDAFGEAVQHWIDTQGRRVTAKERAFVRGRGVKYVYLCNSCSNILEWRKCFISLHASEFPNCTGPGPVDRVPLPYCPQCEPQPENQGCVHMPYA